MNQEELDELEIGDKVLYKEKNVVGEVIGGDGITEPTKRLNFSSDDIRESEVPEVIPPEKLIHFPLCEQEHKQAIYSDKEDEWVCPFCREEGK